MYPENKMSYLARISTEQSINYILVSLQVTTWSTVKIAFILTVNQ